MVSRDSNQPARVLVVDDQMAMAETLADGLTGRGYEAVAVSSGAAALEQLERDDSRFDAVVTDLRMTPMDGLALLAGVQALDAELPVLVMTAYGAIDTAVECIRRGASHYLVKPFRLDELIVLLERALADRALRREAITLRHALGAAPRGVLGRSLAMREVFDRVARVADADVPVLILGETGTGKNVVATALHAQGRRARGPLVVVNCAALPETLLESELFGHARGAFTGATHARDGLVVQAQGGTLFLDEIGEMSAGLQAKLLDFLERGVVRPVGTARELAVDARVLAATHRDLRAMATAGTFREDLLYRLDVVAIELPPLRQRPDDLPELIEHFLGVARARHPQSVARGFSHEVLSRLLAYRWPGNVRELAHVIERLVLLARQPEVPAADLPANLLADASTTRTGAWPAGPVRPIREVTRAYAVWALAQCGGSRTRTAERLGIDGKTLARWLADAG